MAGGQRGAQPPQGRTRQPSSPAPPPTNRATEAPATQDPKQAALAKITRWIGAKTDLLETLCGSKAMAKRFGQTLIMAIADNPYLLTCDLQSLFKAALYCARRGLEVGVPDGAALVPFKGKVTPIVQYRALAKQAKEFDNVTVVARLVFEKDTFEVDFVKDPIITVHKRPPLGTERGNVLGGYCIFTFPDGSKLYTEPMDIQDILKRRDASAAWQDLDKRDKTPWATWEREMIQKTVVKDAFRLIPTGPKMRDFMLEDSKLEGGASLDDVLDIDLLSAASLDEPPAQKQLTKVEEMAKAAQDRLATAQKVGEGEGVKEPEQEPGPGAGAGEAQRDPAAAAVAAGAAEAAQDPEARIEALKPRVEAAGLQDNLFSTFKIASWDDLKTAPEKLFAMEKFVEAAEKQKK